MLVLLKPKRKENKMTLPLSVLMPQLETVKLTYLIYIWVNCPRPIGAFREFFERVSGKELSQEGWQLFPKLLHKASKEKCSGMPDRCSSCFYFEQAIPPPKTKTT
ncbi:MAG: hypothetical protein Q8N55_02770 [bacterium]|nr:hypothetical protein [bacterium]